MYVCTKANPTDLMIVVRLWEQVYLLLPEPERVRDKKSGRLDTADGWR